MNKNKIFLWVGILMMLFSLSAIATLLITNRKQQQQLAFQGQSYCVLNAPFYKKDLQFTSQQMEAFHNAHAQFQHESRSIVARLDSLKAEALDRISQEQPDTLQTLLLADAMGAQHAALKKALFRYYLIVKAICTDTQLPVFEQRFAPVIGNDCLEKCENPQKRKHAHFENN